ncbi:DUF7344 domain-containing protein [Natrinema salaciae]|nr:hypothetical protein [Natrinema salaciae]
MTVEEVTDTLEVMESYLRRNILRYLIMNDGEAFSTEEIANHINASFFGREAQFGSREEIIVGLHHNHLPRLKEIGILDYKPESKEVRYWGHTLVEEILKAIPHGK